MAKNINPGQQLGCKHHAFETVPSKPQLSSVVISCHTQCVIVSWKQLHLFSDDLQFSRCVWFSWSICADLNFIGYHSNGVHPRVAGSKRFSLGHSGFDIVGIRSGLSRPQTHYRITLYLGGQRSWTNSGGESVSSVIGIDIERPQPIFACAVFASSTIRLYHPAHSSRHWLE